MYVAPDVVPVYRAMLPLSTVITPNWFEVEVLTDTKIENLSTLRSAIAKLHYEYKVPNVVISSLPIKPWLWECLPVSARLDLLEEDTEYLLCVAAASSMEAGNTESVHSNVHIGLVTLLPGYFSGVGDLFSSTLLAHFNHPTHPSSSLAPGQTPLSHATSVALHKTHGILKLTHEHALTLPEDERQPTDEEKDTQDPMRKIKRMRGRELRLIQGQSIIRDTSLAGVKEMQPWSEFWTLS
jgi:pyridoxine kinase